MSKITPGWRIVGIIAICIIGFVAIRAEDWYYRYYPFVPLTLESVTIINDAPIHPGDLLAYAVKGVKHKTPFGNEYDAPTVRRQLINSYNWPSTYSKPPKHRPAGPFNDWFSYIVPRATDYGPHQFVWEACYPVGYEGRQVCVYKITDPFMVAPGGKNDLKGERGERGFTGTGKSYSIFGGEKGDPGKPGKDAVCINGKCPEVKKK